MNEPDVFPDEDVSDWYRHPGTISKLKLWSEKRDAAQQALHRACSSSSDPVVRAAYQDFVSALATVVTLSPPRKDLNGKR